MPFNVEIKSGGTIIYTTVTGELNEADSLAHAKFIAEDPRIQPGFRQLFDGRGITNAAITPETIQKYARILASNPERMNRARSAVVSLRKDAFDMQGLFPVVETPTVIVFSDLQSARTWLGLKEDE